MELEIDFKQPTCYGCGTTEIFGNYYGRWTCWPCQEEVYNTQIEIAEWREANENLS